MALRAIEIFLVAVAVVLTAIPMAIVAAIVWLNLGHPILFAQYRAGRDGVPFKLFKFRTMNDQCDLSGNLLADEQRQTRVTAVLRRTRLDELPQLFAVLKGRMALIGPRPLRVETVMASGELGARRCRVRPGLTGWSQVSGNTSLSNDEKIALDLWYIDNRTLALDLRILVETVGVVFFGERLRLDRISRAKAHLVGLRSNGPLTDGLRRAP